MKFIYDDQGRLSEITFAENDNQEVICKMIENMQKNVCDAQKNYSEQYFNAQKNYSEQYFNAQRNLFQLSMVGNIPQIPMQ